MTNKTEYVLPTGTGTSNTLSGGAQYVLSGGTANVVTVSAGIAYNLNIAGATVGETNFHFSSGSLLTESLIVAPRAAPAGMVFLRPAEARPLIPAAPRLALTGTPPLFAPSAFQQAAAPAGADGSAAPAWPGAWSDPPNHHHPPPPHGW